MKLHINKSKKFSIRKQPEVQGEAGYKTLHKIAGRSYKQPFGSKNFKKRGLMTAHFGDGNLK